MKIKQTKLCSLKKEIKAKKEELQELENRFRTLDHLFFVQNCGRPIYDYKDFMDKPLDAGRAHETKSIWWDTGTISDMTRENVSIWVCKFCKTPIRRKHIATGHDHTDYSYEVCDCKGSSRGKPYHDLQ